MCPSADQQPLQRRGVGAAIDPFGVDHSAAAEFRGAAQCGRWAWLQAVLCFFAVAKTVLATTRTVFLAPFHSRGIPKSSRKVLHRKRPTRLLLIVLLKKNDGTAKLTSASASIFTRPTTSWDGVQSTRRPDGAGAPRRRAGARAPPERRLARIPGMAAVASRWPDGRAPMRATRPRRAWPP